MFRYTPQPHIVDHIRQILREPWRLNRQWYYVRELIGTDYAMYCVFVRCYEGFELYSPKKLKEVPMGGYMFPKHLFVEVER